MRRLEIHGMSGGPEEVRGVVDLFVELAHTAVLHKSFASGAVSQSNS